MEMVFVDKLIPWHHFSKVIYLDILYIICFIYIYICLLYIYIYTIFLSIIVYTYYISYTCCQKDRQCALPLSPHPVVANPPMASWQLMYFGI